MPHRLEQIRNNGRLRKRFLIGSLTLTSFIIGVLCYVGYNILMDLGKDFAQQQYNTEFQALEHKLQHVAPPLSSATPINFDKQPAENDPIVLFQVEKTSTYLAPEMNRMSFQTLKKQANGFFILEGQKYYLKRSDGTQATDAITIIWRVEHLGKLSAIVIKRLSLAAFFTFCISILGALVMSTFIARRFENASKALELMALTDSLTQLKNRNALFSGEVSSDTKDALFFIDLDRFRDINEALGNDAGDRLLIAFARRLATIAGEKASVYRYRSDEFVIWITNADHVIDRAFTLLYKCREPLKLGRSVFELSCSIGVSISPYHGDTIELLLQNAENAMHRAKKLRLGVQIYNERLAYDRVLQVTLRSQLRTALVEKQFTLHYQPKISLQTGELAGAEAMVRWQHPEEGLLFPAKFIDLIEQSGIIHVFSRYIIEMAVLQIKEWHHKGLRIPVAVNLSAYNLIDSAFITFVKSQLEKSGIEPGLLEFELTETATMVDISISKRMLSAFRGMGIKTSIDDFGTGMSSFAYLRDLDVDTVKLDQSFIRKITLDDKNRKIVEGMVGLCKHLQIEVVAEGIENKEQVKLLQKIGCHVGQGYFFGKPSSPAELYSLVCSHEGTPVVFLH